MGNNVPCKCGHSKRDHSFEDDGSFNIILKAYGDSWCKRCCLKPGIFTNENHKSFHNFKPDNLRYLELEYTKKGN
jgi:hypothetical protein